MAWPNTTPPWEPSHPVEPGNTFSVAATPSAALEARSAALAGDSATNAFTGITSAAFPAAVAIAFDAAWDGGDVTVIGEDQFGNPRTDVLVADPGNTVVGVVAFQKIDSASKGLVGVDPSTATLATGKTLGIAVQIADPLAVAVFVDASGTGAWTFDTDQAVVDVANNTVTPKTDPDGTVLYMILVRGTD